MLHRSFRTLVSLQKQFSTTASPIIRRKNKSSNEQSIGFVDRREVKVFGGKGGDGCISMASVFAKEFAGPDGGDGGNGGHVLFTTDSNVRSLNGIPSILKGRSGGKGSNRNCHGENAKHLMVQVPLGTIFKNSETKELVMDLSKEGMVFVGAKGGAGGKGNKFFATSGNQSPEVAEYGAEGEIASYIIEMATIAHFGLVGYPNAGKSTLLRAISRARPKVADYPFTTLRPHVGMVAYQDLIHIAVADIPGLIEDAHLNRGLGINFLRHITRCLSLIFVLDFSSPNPWDEYETLKSELNHYDATLLSRPQIIVANKMDVKESLNNLIEFRKMYKDKEIYPISAKNGINLKNLLLKIRNVFDNEMNINNNKS